MVPPSPNYYSRRVLFPESRLTKVFKTSPSPRKRAQPRDLTLLLPCARKITIWDADSPNGELYWKLTLQLDAHLNSPSRKMHGDWPDTLPSARKTAWYQLLNPKSYLTVTTQLTSARRLLRESSPLSLRHSKTTMYSLRDASWNQTWSPQEEKLQKSQLKLLPKELF
jgi:hypothetical protein